MNGFTIQRKTDSKSGALTVRDAVAPVFRQRRLALALFGGILGGAVLAALLIPAQYEAEMKILVNRDRAEEVVTPERDTRIVSSQAPSVTEQDLNSEVELLKSRDLLEQVAAACHLDASPSGFWGSLRAKWDARQGAQQMREREMARAVEALENRIVAEPLNKTSLIRVTYRSPDPQLSARVLQTLAALYRQKHAEVHRPAGAFQFFEREAERYRQELATREARLQRFDAEKGLIDPDAQKQLALQEVSRLQTQLDQDRAGIRAAQERVDELKTLQNASPERQTTLMKRTDNAQLLAALNSTLLSLELKRSEMLTKYAPDYPLVRETETQIADASRALAEAQKRPVEEITTDRTPAQDWIATEMTKAQTDRAALEAEAGSIERAIRGSQAAAMRIDRESGKQANLAREAKAAEENYTLYQRKREEARISELLDEKRIVNVSVAEAATAPAFPVRSWAWILALGFFGAGAASLGGAYAADRLDPLFRTPDELGRYLEIKVLAAIPAETLKQ